MSDYLALSWSTKDDEAQACADKLVTLLAREKTGYSVAVRSAGLLIASRAEEVRQLAPNCWLIGDVFAGAMKAAHAAQPQGAAVTDFADLCGWLVAQRWGSYVALYRDQAGDGADSDRVLSAFVDPIGMRESTSWIYRGVRVVTSDPDAWLMHLAPEGLALDLDEIGRLVAQACVIPESRPIAGIHPLDPGVLTRFDGAMPTHLQRLWEPRQFCREQAITADPAALARLIDGCVSAWGSYDGPATLELSGGLDSAIVAACLARTPSPPASFTFFSTDLAGDERRFSRAIAAHLGQTNHEIVLTPRSLETADLDAAAIGIRPGIGSTTFFHDAVLAERSKAMGATTLFTGRGGDAVFFQHPTPLVIAEPWSSPSRSPILRIESLASWCRTTVWAVAAQAMLPQSAHSCSKGGRFAAQRFKPRVGRWAGHLERLTPAKRMQIEALAGDRAAFGPSQCAAAMRVVHPLMSQPLVEHALGQSIMVLTDGRRDRAAARDAFADRLPPSVIKRRGKGALGIFFGRTLALSVPLLKDRLLDGALSDARLIDRAGLEAALTPESIMRTDDYTELLALLLIERWMRGWKDRLAPGMCP
jgi:asparagine synthase (glutamine-hydrolysing)